jgi:hypothetical protein
MSLKRFTEVFPPRISLLIAVSAFSTLFIFASAASDAVLTTFYLHFFAVFSP